METFDDISCEEYNAIYEELSELRAWMEANEAEYLAQERNILTEAI